MTDSNINILIVEDDRFQAQLLKMMLTNMKYNVEALTATGEEAVTLASELKPDLIFMDIALAGEMDGIEAVRRISEDSSSVKIIYVTSNSDQKKRAEKVGFDDFLVKPISKEILANSLRKIYS
jgi:CheY-like chemotaxis protein